MSHNVKDFFALKTNEAWTKIRLADLAVKLDEKLVIKLYKELLIVSPSNIVYLNNLAWTEYKQNDYSQAKLTIKKALELAPNQPLLIDTSALIEWELGNQQHATDLLKKALLLAPKNIDITKHLEERIKQL